MTPHSHAGKRPEFMSAEHDHTVCIEAAVTAAEEACARTGQRLTPLRQRVLEIVWDGHHPIGAYAILDKLKADGRAAAPPTVYRALDFLRENGLIHRIESLNAFVGCTQPGEPHLGQFLICRRCGTTAEIEDPQVSEAVTRSVAAIGFRIESRVIELSGLCAACQMSAPHGA